MKTKTKFNAAEEIRKTDNWIKELRFWATVLFIILFVLIMIQTFRIDNLKDRNSNLEGRISVLENNIHELNCITGNYNKSEVGQVSFTGGFIRFYDICGNLSYSYIIPELQFNEGRGIKFDPYLSFLQHSLLNTTCSSIVHDTTYCSHQDGITFCYRNENGSVCVNQYKLK